ncbi:hypothetical protein ACWEFL_15660 [Streptomyces sp. NPDC004838]
MKHFCTWCLTTSGTVAVAITHQPSGSAGRTLYACPACRARKGLLPLDHPTGSNGSTVRAPGTPARRDQPQ